MSFKITGVLVRSLKIIDSFIDSLLLNIIYTLVLIYVHKRETINTTRL